MGYYSELKVYSAFKSKYSKSEIDAKLEEFKESHKDDSDIGYMDIYEFVETNGRIAIECLDRYDKHYADELLAEFISTIIDESDYCLLQFVGEDGSCWGYFILSGRIIPIGYVPQIEVDGEIYTLYPDPCWLAKIADKIRKNKEGKK